MPEPMQIEVVAPNLKKRLSGVTATVVRLIPRRAAIWAFVKPWPTMISTSR